MIETYRLNAFKGLHLYWGSDDYNPHTITVLASFKGSKAHETLLHRLLKTHRYKGEWFIFDPQIIELAELISTNV